MWYTHTVEYYLLLLSRFSHVRLCATPETAAYQAPPSLGCSRQNTGVGCHCLLQYYSAIKNEILSFAAIWMDLEIIILSEISQRKTNIIYHLHVQSKTGHKWIYLWNRNRLTDTENGFVVASGQRRRERDGLGIGVSRCKLLYRKWINNKVLLYITGNYTQYPMINYNRKEQ